MLNHNLVSRKSVGQLTVIIIMAIFMDGIGGGGRTHESLTLGSCSDIQGQILVSQYTLGSVSERQIQNIHNFMYSLGSQPYSRAILGDRVSLIFMAID